MRGTIRPVRAGPREARRKQCAQCLLHCVSDLLSLRWLIDDDSESFASSLINGILTVMKVDTAALRNYTAFGPRHHFILALK
jgi:hypothetical protein